MNNITGKDYVNYAEIISVLCTKMNETTLWLLEIIVFALSIIVTFFLSLETILRFSKI